MAREALTFRDVSAGYSHRHVLSGVSFAVREGEFVSLIGPNGSGKSTLLKTAAALIKPHSGSVGLFGEDVSTLRPSVRASMLGVVPQKLEAPMAFSVSEIVMNGRVGSMGLLGRLSPHDHDLIERAMIYTDVLDLRDRYFGELSGGEQQRVALAMVLAQEPRIIMLDESISHLDINHRNEVLQILLNLNREQQLTIVLVSHDLTLSASVSDRLLLMHEGRLAAEGSPHEVLTVDLLGSVYDCELLVRPDPFTGSLQVTGNLEGRKMNGSPAVRAHVVAGGGSGIELYRRLVLEGFGVTTGVLNQLDSDAEAARALSIPAVLEQPFSAVGIEAAEKARVMVAEADAVIISHVPFGSGNLVNLQIADEALRQCRRVFIAQGIEDRDYTENKAASRLAADMMARGALSWQTMHELIMKLQQQQQT